MHQVLSFNKRRLQKLSMLIFRYKRNCFAVFVSSLPLILLFILVLKLSDEENDVAVNLRQSSFHDTGRKLQPLDGFDSDGFTMNITFIANALNAYRAPVVTESRDKKESILLYRVDTAWEQMFATQGGPGNYLPNYKNPCWKSRVTKSFPFFDNHYYTYHDIWGREKQALVDKLEQQAHTLRKSARQGQGLRTRCLPAFYVLGVTKSGTTDLYEKLLMHPKILSPIIKEPMWWNRLRLGRREDPFPLKSYIDLFDEAALLIQEKVRTLQNGSSLHPLITGDFTPSYLWDYDGWESIPGNRGMKEPAYILAHSIKALQPNAKFVIFLREPTDRLYSQFRMWSHRISAQRFHDLIVLGLKAYIECFKLHSVRHCAYSKMLYSKLEDPHGIYIRASMYYVFLRDWLGVFPPEQFLIVKAEDYFNDRVKVMVAVFKFLGLEKVENAVLTKIAESSVPNARSKKKVISQEAMLPETDRLLKTFFKPFNEKLAAFLKRDEFLWQ